MLQVVDHPTRGKIILTGWPLRMSGSQTPDVICPPLLGQHTAEILADYLGLEAASVQEFRAAGVV